MLITNKLGYFFIKTEKIFAIDKNISLPCGHINHKLRCLSLKETNCKF